MAYLFRHFVQSHAVGTVDMPFLTIVRPRAQDEQTTGSTSIETYIRRLVVFAKAVVRQENERMSLSSGEIKGETITTD